jgi:hypothetical protein
MYSLFEINEINKTFEYFGVVNNKKLTPFNFLILLPLGVHLIGFVTSLSLTLRAPSASKFVPDEFVPAQNKRTKQKASPCWSSGFPRFSTYLRYDENSLRSDNRRIFLK